MRKKQTSVSHSSTEVEIISLDAGSRMDGIPALTLWDLEIEIFHSVPNRTDRLKREREPRRNPSAVVKPNMHNYTSQSSTPTSFQEEFCAFSTYGDIDHIPSNTMHSGTGAVLYVFEDNAGENQNDYQKSKSHNETCFTDPQSCSGLVV